MSRYIEGAPQSLPPAPWNIEGCEFEDALLRVVEAVRRLEAMALNDHARRSEASGRQVACMASGPRAATIARHLSAFETHLRGVAAGFSAEARLSDASDAVAALREAFAALDGGAAVAGEAAGLPLAPSPPKPAGWVVKKTMFWTTTGWSASHSCSKVQFRSEKAAMNYGWGAPVEALPVDASGNILPAPPEAERLASAAPTPAPSPKPPREVVGYRVRDVPERRYVEPDHDGFWRPVKPPKVVTREKAERLRDLAVEWACNSGRDLRFRLVRVTRRQRPDVSAAIAACETALHESEQPGCIAPHVRARIGLRTALAALRGQR